MRLVRKFVLCIIIIIIQEPLNKLISFNVQELSGMPRFKKKKGIKRRYVRAPLLVVVEENKLKPHHGHGKNLVLLFDVINNILV